MMIARSSLQLKPVTTIDREPKDAQPEDCHQRYKRNQHKLFDTPRFVAFEHVSAVSA